ncbi:YfiT family bacillithiol transferase [Pseudofulvibacter geojedonensis]|uniref:YfiT family bacillithiol transferase n=1 Tax=Pseudofulvibacter geojedonensis TaxID=1123758 RepID=A0ABW3I0N0_9FLAO
MDLEQLKYPIGKPNLPEEISSNHINLWIQTIEEFPTKIESEIEGLSNKEFGYRYRPNGWNIKQVINHCIDSHINSFVRFKLALTEDNPTIKPYREDLWAELPDTVDYNVDESLSLLKSIHRRWAYLLNSLSESDLCKTFIHPDGNEKISLKENLCIYAWHCKHHLAHIRNAKKEQY